MAKTLFAIVAVFCFVQIVCTSPVLRLKREDDLLTEKGRRMIFYTTIFTIPELLLLASANTTHGTSSFLPTNQFAVADKRNHVISKSLMEVWMNLRTMEAAQLVLNKTITEFATTTIESLKSSDGGPMNLYFEVLDKALALDEVTGTLYEEAKNKYERLVNLEPDHLEKEKKIIDNEYFVINEKNLQIRIYYLNYLFCGILQSFNLSEATVINDLFKNDVANLEFYLTGQALIETSKHTFFCRYKKLQNIYEECLTQIARKDIRGEFKENMGQEIRKLLPKLINEKINADPSLKAEFDQQKRILRNKLDAVRSGW